MMEGDIEHPVSEFGSLPWQDLDPNKCTRDWSYSYGRNKMFINIVHKDGTADVWECPNSFYALVEMVRLISKNSIRSEIEDALNYQPKIFELLKKEQPDWDRWWS